MDPAPSGAEPGSFRGTELLASFADGGAYFFDGLLPSGTGLGDRADYVQALWDLVWCGLITGDTFTPVRNLATGGAHKRATRPSARMHRARPQRPPRPRGTGRIASPTTTGRWSLVQRTPVSASTQLAADIFAQLDRYGVVTRGSVMTENLQGGFGTAYRALSSLEETGQCRRGYFIEGLGAAQFALPGAVDRLRAELREPEHAEAVVLAACDPANPYGSALPWPEREGHRPGRKAGALVVLVNGRLVFYVERGGKTLLTFADDPELVRPAAVALARSVNQGLLGKLTVERADGEHVFESGQVSDALQEAGFRMTPQGLRLRPAVVA
jgi:ATP-dependent Lhr-like helicase